MVSAAWFELAARAASIACASRLLNNPHAKSVAATETATTVACALFALCAADLARRTFFFIEGSGLFANLDAIVLLSVGFPHYHLSDTHHLCGLLQVLFSI
jgi:hypothetical protein